MNDRETRTIVEHPKRGKVVRLMFRLYATGEYSVESLRKTILTETGKKISKGLGDHAKAAIDDQVKSGHREKA